MEIKRVGIIGCGKIFPRHVQAIESNSDYELKAICDINSDILFEQKQRLLLVPQTEHCF